MKSSRNAWRHGLTLPVTADPTASMKARRMAQMLVPAEAHPMQTMAAVEMARAHVQLLRVAVVRSKLMADLDFTSPNLNQVRQLVALERYERQALTKRRKAAQILEV